MKEVENPIEPQFVELSELQNPAPAGPAILAGNMAVLHGIKVKLKVVVGEAHTTLGELMSLQEQAVLKIDRQVDTPLDLIVDGNVVARGQLVVVDDNFGIRITEIAPRTQS